MNLSKSCTRHKPRPIKRMWSYSHDKGTETCVNPRKDLAVLARTILLDVPITSWFHEDFLMVPYVASAGSNQKICETRMADQWPREVSGSGLASVKDPSVIYLFVSHTWFALRRRCPTDAHEIHPWISQLLAMPQTQPNLTYAFV